MDNKISIVIRTYNEQKHLDELLQILDKQTYRNFEIIIVDSESTDNTLKIAENYNVKIVGIKKSRFNYSYASNIGVNHSTGELICFLSGHSIPIKETFLDTINQVFKDEKVGACYGDVIALADGSLTEKAFNYLGYIKNNNKEIVYESEIHPGIMSCSNAVARKELLIRHPFKEALGKGGEDVEVAYRIIKDGYFIARVPKLLVRHSHGSKLFKFIKEFKSWRMMYKDVLEYIDKYPT